MSKIQTTKGYRGFTLVETLVAILALTLSLGALTTITSRTVINARDAQLRIQAEMLATEAMEVIQYIVLTGIQKDGKIPDTVKSCANGCGINFTAGSAIPVSTLTSCSNFNSCGVVYNNPAGGLSVAYTNSSTAVGTATPFRRLIFIKPTSLGDGGIFLRSVVWYGPTTATVPKQVVLTKELRPWYMEQVITTPPTTP